MDKPKQISIVWKTLTFDQLDTDIPSGGGVYLWIARTNPERVLYVGTTHNFKERTAHHLRMQMSGSYLEFYFDRNKDLLSFFAEEIFAANRDNKYHSCPSTQNKANFTVPTNPKDSSFRFSKIVPELNRIQQRANFVSNDIYYAFGSLVSPETTSQTISEYAKDLECTLQVELEQHYLGILREEPFCIKDLESLTIRGSRKNHLIIGAKLKNPSYHHQFILEGDALPKEVYTCIDSANLKTLSSSGRKTA